MKKFLATLGMVGILSLNVGTVFAAVALNTITVGSQTGTLSEGVGSSVTYTVTVSGSGSGTLNSIGFSTTGLPVGVSASFSPTTVSLTNGNGHIAATTLTLTSTNAAAAGTTGFTVTNTENAVTGSGSLTIGAPLTAQSITVNTSAPGSAVYNSTFPVAATASSGLTVAITTTGSCSVAGGTVTMTSGTGTCTVHYNQSGNGTYSAAPEITESTTATPKSLTPSVATGVNKVYDSTNTASVTACSLTGIVAPDVVTCSATSATFADATVGTAKVVTETGITLAGANASNYTLSSASADTTADITTSPRTVTADPQTKVAGDADPALTYALSTPLFGADVFIGVLARDPGETAGVYAITQGTLDNTNYAITYTGADLTITPAPNTAPTADAQAVTADEDVAKVITLTGSDSDVPVQTLTYSIVTGPTNGTLGTVSGNQVTYTSNANYNGSDSFTFKTNDGIVDSAPATVSVTVNTVNDVPSFTAGIDQTVSEDATAQTVMGWATAMSTGPADESTQVLDFIVTNNNNSLFSVQPAVSAMGDLTYTLAVNANGVATVTVKAHDDGTIVNGGVDTSAGQTFTITVSAVNDAPVLAALTDATQNEGTTFSFTASATDVDLPADTLTYSLTGEPSGASINSSTGAFSWVTTETDGPNTYTFDVNVSDGQGGTDTKSVTLTVDEVNATPTTAGAVVATHQNTLRTITLIGSDSDVPVQTLTYSIVTGPTNGTLGTVSGNQVDYTPNAGYNGPDSFTFIANDTVIDSNTSTVTISVDNTAPQLAAIASLSISEEVAFSFTASATDIDNVPTVQDILTYSITSPAVAGAAIDSSTGEFTWTPTEAQGPGVYDFTVQVSDGGPSPDSQSFQLTVDEVNLAPVAADVSATTDEDTLTTVTLVGTDVDAPVQALTYSVVAGPTNGTLGAILGDQVDYTPNLNWNGTDSFTYKVNDGVTDSAVATVTITVDPVNDAPTISLTSYSEYFQAQNTPYVDPGTQADDIEDGDITANVVVTGTVDIAIVGIYPLTYTITDVGGLTAQTARNVHVYGPAGGEGTGSGNGIVGCRDPRATNYNAQASYDSGACTYGQVLGASTSTVTTATTTNGTGSATSTPGLVVTVSTSTPSTGGQVLGATAFAFTRNLGFGARGDDVLELQKILIAGGHMTIDAPTKYFGPLTRAALKLWQTKNGIPSTGFFGTLSRGFLAK